MSSLGGKYLQQEKKRPFPSSDGVAFAKKVQHATTTVGISPPPDAARIMMGADATAATYPAPTASFLGGNFFLSEAPTPVADPDPDSTAILLGKRFFLTPQAAVENVVAMPSLLSIAPTTVAPVVAVFKYGRVPIVSRAAWETRENVDSAPVVVRVFIYFFCTTIVLHLDPHCSHLFSLFLCL